MSSANSLALLFRESGKSFIYARNKQGPRTEPWGTPDMTGTVGDCLPSTTTDCDLFWKNDLIHETVLRFTPRLNSLYISVSYGLLCQMLH